MLCDVPSMAVSGEATAASVEVKSTLVARVAVSQNCLHAPYTCRSVHIHTPHYSARRASAARSIASPKAPAALQPAARLPPRRLPPVPCG